MKAKDLQEIQKTKKSNLQKNRSRLRKVVWGIVIIAAILILSIGQDIGSYIAAALITILAVELHILLKYIDSTLLTWDLLISLTIGYFLAFCSFILVPIDTAEAIRRENQLGTIKLSKSDTNYNETYYKWWQVIYWTMLGINMVFMNLQNLFHKTGHLLFLSRIKATIIAYIKLIVVFIVPYVIGVVVIFIFTKTVQSSVMTQVFLLLSNIYGITVLVLLIGYGLVQYPCYLWRKTNHDSSLDLLLSRASQLHDRYIEAQGVEQQCSLKMQAIIEKMYDSHPFASYRPMLLEELPNLDEYTSYRQSSKNLHSLEEIPADITEEVIAQARFQLKASAYNFVKVFNKWKQHCDRVFRLVEIESLENKQSSDVIKKPEVSIKKQESPKKKNKKSKEGGVLASKFLTSSYDQNSTQLYRQLKVIPMSLSKQLLYRTGAVILGLISILILFCETALVFSTENNKALVFYRIIEKSTNVGGVTFFIILVLGYILFCSCFALFEIDLGAGFEIYPYHTHPLTMMFNSKTCGTIAIPLCYNVMLLFQQVDNSQLQIKSGFDTFYKPMTSVPFFGTWYNLIVCLMISVVGFLSLFSSLKKIVSKVTKNKIDMGSDDIELENIKSGEKWVIWEWTRRKRMQSIQNLSKRGDYHTNKQENPQGDEEKGNSVWNKFKGILGDKKETDKQEKAKNIELKTEDEGSSKEKSIKKKEEVEEAEIITRIKYQQQLLQEISLEDMVAGKGRNKIIETKELDMNDSFFENKNKNNQKKEKVEVVVPVLQINSSPEKQDNSDRRSTLSERKAANALYNKMNEASSQKHLDTLDSFSLEHSESEESPQTNRAQKDLKVDHSRSFEININGNSLVHPKQQDKNDNKNQSKKIESINKESKKKEFADSPPSQQSSVSSSLSLNDSILISQDQNQKNNQLISSKNINDRQADLDKQSRGQQDKSNGKGAIENKWKDEKGWVQKKSENQMMRKLQGWKNKYLVLSKDELNYFDDEEQTKNRHNIKLKDISKVSLYLEDPQKAKKETDDGGLRFMVTCKNRKYDFKTAKPEEASNWVKRINLVLNQ